jgi:hypothetical protein
VFHVPDLNFPQAGVAVLIQIDVDGEMGVDVAHLVLVALCHADDEVVDQRPDGAEGSDVFSCAMVEFDVDDARRRVGEGDSEMAEILGELACGPVSVWRLRRALEGIKRTSWALDGDDACLDVDLDALGDGKRLLRVNVLHD